MQVDHAPTSTRQQDRMPVLAGWLGALGLIPFLSMAGVAITGWPAMPFEATRALVGYGAVILSFLGGIHWGAALAPPANPETAPPDAATWVMGVLPSIVAWFALLLPAAPGLALLALAFLAQWWLDARACARGKFPAWFAKLRMRLSLIVISTLVLSLIFPG